MGRRKPAVEQEDESPAEEDLAPTGGFLRRWTRRLLMLGIAGGTLAVMAPTVVGALGLTDRVVGAWLPPGMSLRVGKADLAWWSPVRLHDVSFRMQDESLDVQVAEIAASATLAELALRPMKFGTVRLESPKIMAKVSPPTEPEGSAADSTPAAEPAPSWLQAIPVSLRGTLEAVGGSLQVEDGLGGTWSLVDVEGKIDVGPDAERLLAGHLAGAMADSNHASVKGDLTLRRDGVADGSVAATQFPLGMINPILAWRQDESRLAGLLTGQADFHADQQQLEMKTTGQVTQFVLASPFLEPDRLSLRSIESAMKFTVSESVVRIEQGEVRCDAGQARASGTIDLTKMDDPAAQNLSLQGEIDLPTLAARLPHLVRIRQDVSIEAGLLSVQVTPVAGSAGRWDATTEVSDFRASRSGKPIAWTKPVSVQARAGQSEGELVVDQFVCESDFLRAKGSGRLSNFDVSAVCDLSRLQDRLGELLDLGDTRLAGRFSGRVQSQKTPQGTVAWRGAAKAEGLEVRVDGQTLLAEPQLQGQFQLTSAGDRQVEIVDAAVVLKTDREHLNAHLVEAVTDWEKGPWGTWDLQASGDLAELVRRGTMVSSPGGETKATGVGVVSGRFQFGTRETRIENLIVDVQGLSITSPSIRLADKRVRLETSGVVDAEELSIALGPTSVVGQSMQMRTDRLRGKLTDDGLALACRAEIAGDLATVRSWSLAPATPVDLAGQFQGTVGLESDGKRWSTTIDGVVQDLRYGTGPTPMLDEPKVELAGRASADGVEQGLHVQDFRVSVPGLVVTASGDISELSAQQVVQLSGIVDYDWSALSPRLRGLVGDQIVLEGRDRRAFRLSGPMGGGSKVEFAAAQDVAVGRYPGLQGDFSLGWERARLYGFVAGPANIDGKLADSWVVTQPVVFPLNQGKVELRPGLFFATQASYLHHPAGRLAERVQVTREMCEGALQYIAPVLAQSVEVQGRVSIDVEEIKVPLGRLEQADFAGRVVMEETKASGSPLLRELLVLTDGQPVVEIASGSEIRFQVRQGRVYHEGLQLKLPGMMVETSGFVGMDRSLELTAEMPIPPRWYPNERIRERLAGQRLRVPIGGTLDQPRIDKQAFQRQVGRLMEESAGRLIEGELNKQIDKQLGKFLDKLK